MIEAPKLEGAVLELTDLPHNIFTTLEYLCGSGGYFLQEERLINISGRELRNGVRINAKSRSTMRDDVALGAVEGNIVFEVTLSDSRSRRNPIRYDFFRSRFGGLRCVYRQCDTFNPSHPYSVHFSGPSIIVQDSGNGYGATIEQHRLVDEGFTSIQVADMTQEVMIDLRCIEATFLRMLRERYGETNHGSGNLRQSHDRIVLSVQNRTALLLDRNRDNLSAGETGAIF